MSNMKDRIRETASAAGVRDSMAEYIASEMSGCIEMRGVLVPIDKRKIETRFCFGYDGWCNDAESAFAEARAARTDSSYFMRENLAWYDGEIKRISESDKLFLKKSWYGTGYVADCDGPGAVGGSLTEDEKRQYIQLIVSEREKMEKRLNKYLKRYGLSKLTVWTYLRD